jgi:hypothetical protein
MSGMTEHEEAMVKEIVDAVAVRDPDRTKLLLHPYLHWTDRDGDRKRGRMKVLALLRSRDGALGPPTAIEFRDEQVYRWS